MMEALGISEELRQRIRDVLPVLVYLKLGLQAPNGLSMLADETAYFTAGMRIITVTVWDDTEAWELDGEELTFSFTFDDIERAEGVFESI